MNKKCKNINIKHLHIMTNSNYKVVENYIRFINEEFNREDHTFLIRDSKDNTNHALQDVENIIWLPNAETKDIKKLFSYLKLSQHIYWHYMQWTAKTQFLISIHPSIIKKSIWIAWGADLYNWKMNGKNIKAKIRNSIMYFLRSHFLNFVSIFPPDIEVFKKNFKSKATTYYAPYVDGIYNPIYKKKFSDEKSDSCINIQIGHSATRMLNHNEVLDCLYKFKNDNIKIYIPLGYGDITYKSQVVEKANKLFGSKAICITEMMDKDDYMEFLSRMDIAIFNTPRQIGLGNILPLLYMGKKIFMPSSSVMYEFYKEYDVEICDYAEIKQMDFENFSSKVDGDSGKKYVKECITDKEKLIEMWKKVFNE